ncbi:MAG: hypothetical protein V3V96_14715 [Acidiferrobacterales bacterium]
MKHLIFLTPNPNDNAYNREQQDGWLAAIAEASKAIDGVIVCPWACDEDLNAWDRPYMRTLVSTIRTHGMELVNGRDLFPRKDDGLLGFLAPGDPVFYTRALATLEAERRRLGCDISWLSSEPYDVDDTGRRFFSDKINGWKRNGHTPADARRIRHAIAGVSSHVPRATVIEPGPTAYRPKGKEHYGHAFLDLGLIGAYRDTYRARKPEDLNVPDPDAVQCCGSWVSINPTDPAFVGKYGEGVLSCEEYMEHIVRQEPAWKDWFRKLALWWVYTLAEEKRAVMLRFGELALAA